MRSRLQYNGKRMREFSKLGNTASKQQGSLWMRIHSMNKIFTVQHHEQWVSSLSQLSSFEKVSPLGPSRKLCPSWSSGNPWPKVQRKTSNHLHGPLDKRHRPKSGGASYRRQWISGYNDAHPAHHQITLLYMYICAVQKSYKTLTDRT